MEYFLTEVVLSLCNPETDPLSDTPYMLYQLKVEIRVKIHYHGLWLMEGLCQY